MAHPIGILERPINQVLSRICPEHFQYLIERINTVAQEAMAANQGHPALQSGQFSAEVRPADRVKLRELLIYSITTEQLDLGRLLINLGASVNGCSASEDQFWDVVLPSENKFFEVQLYQTPLYTACNQGKEGFVNLLLERRDCLVSETDAEGRTALHASYIPSIIEKLVAAGANVHQISNFNMTPLLYLLQNSYTVFRESEVDIHSAVRVLMQHGADVQPQGPGTKSAFHYAILEIAAESINVMLDFIDPEKLRSCVDENGDNPLTFQMKFWVQYSYDIEEDGIHEKFQRLMQRYCEQGIDVNFENDEGLTALDIVGKRPQIRSEANERKKIEDVKALLRLGANIRVPEYTNRVELGQAKAYVVNMLKAIESLSEEHFFDKDFNKQLLSRLNHPGSRLGALFQNFPSELRKEIAQGHACSVFQLVCNGQNMLKIEVVGYLTQRLEAMQAE